MKVEQLAIFIENRVGRLAEITAILADNRIRIKALSVADTADFGILRLIVDQVEAAKTLLKDRGFTVGGTAVVAVAVSDQTGGLASVLKVMDKENLNVEYMYSIANSRHGGVILIMRFEETDKAVAVLLENQIKVMTGEQICAL